MAVLSIRAVILVYSEPRVILFCAIFLANIPRQTAFIPVFSPTDVLSLTRGKCVVAMSRKFLEQKTRVGMDDADYRLLLNSADVAFTGEHGVAIGVGDFEHFVWPSGKRLETGEVHTEPTAVVFPRIKEDRTCLLTKTSEVGEPASIVYTGTVSVPEFVDFINHHCNTYRREDGSLTIEGLHRDALLEDFFKVEHLPHSVPISKMFEHGNHGGQNCLQDGSEVCHAGHSVHEGIEKFSDVPTCERVSLPSINRHTFFSEYLVRSKPVIITGAMDDWPAMSKWTTEYLREMYGNKSVHIKLTPKGEYEGIETASIWDSYQTFIIPQAVLKQLPYPDLVVVRPATLNIRFSEFLDIIKNVSAGKLTDVSAYLEYTSVSDYFTELEMDIAEMPFFKNTLQLKHLNIWLSDGNTLGKTHFDPFDNFLCQISGEKEVILFEPHSNERLYEAHIPEALLAYNASMRQFRRKTLLDSTSMVMSPLDIQRPNLERFPKFAEARPLLCTIEEGEVLFMPAFWWHEVQSRPSQTQHRNLAVNFWYDPFFIKEFPCPDCHLDVNPKYRHLL